MKTKLLIKLLSMLVVLSIISSITLNVFAATEQDKTNLQDKINQTKKDLNNISDNKEEAQSELDKINDQVSQVQNDISKLKAQLSELNSQIADKEAEIAKEEEEIKAKDELLKQRMVALYEAGDTTFLDVLLNSDNLLDFISGYSVIQTIVETDTKLINELEAQKEQLEKDKEEIESNKSKVEDLKKEQEIKNATLISLQDSKKSEVNKLSEEEKKKQSELEEYNAAMVKVNEELERIWQENQKKTDGINFDGSFIWPCNNKQVTSRMKYRWGRWHKGIDIGARYENVYAAASGYAYNDTNPGGYGIYIMIIHGGGYVTLYGHLNSSHISNGQYVSQGQVIATSGNSGGSTGAHLHFEIRKASSRADFFGNNWLNPLDYLPGGYTMLD